MRIAGPKARVHLVNEGVALMTPGIFQDYASAQINVRTDWASIQKKVLKKTGMCGMPKA